MSYAATAVRYFTAPKPLGLAMEANANNRPRAESQCQTVVRPNVPAEEPSTTVSPKKRGLTFANQDSLPKLPVPDLEDTCRRHLDTLEALQTPREHEETKAAVQEFLKNDGPVLQEILKNYASSKTSFIEQFCRFDVVHVIPEGANGC